MKNEQIADALQEMLDKRADPGWYAYAVNFATAHLRQPSSAPAAVGVPANTATLQFLTDVVTAAGLLSHGKTDKGLATRISERAYDLRAALAAPSAANALPADSHPLRLAAEQFVAAVKDGNAGSMLEYFEDIFSEALAAQPAAPDSAAAPAAMPVSEYDALFRSIGHAARSDNKTLNISVARFKHELAAHGYRIIAAYQPPPSDGYTDEQLGSSYRMMREAKRNGLNVDFLSGTISLPDGPPASDGDVPMPTGDQLRAIVKSCHGSSDRPQGSEYALAGWKAALAALASAGKPSGLDATFALANLLWAALERDKGNRIRQFDEFVDAARAAIATKEAGK